METRKDEFTKCQLSRIIERLCFATGGARVVLYSGVYQALVTAKILPDYVEKASGSSAGSFMATMIALGIDPFDLYWEQRNTNFSELVGERVGSIFGNNSIGVTPITRDNKLMISRMRDIINRTIKKFLNSDEAKQVDNEDFRKLITRFTETDPILTFGDLSLLNKLFPYRFKKLYIETVIYPQGDTCLFSTEETPDDDIALVVCASSAIPGLLPPVEINGRLHADGGTRRHLPTNCFDRPDHLTNQKLINTLVFVFGDSSIHELSSSFKALHGHPDNTQLYEPLAITKYISDNIMPYATGLQASYKNTEEWNTCYLDIAKNYPLNTVDIHTHGLESLNFYFATLFTRQYYTTGYLDTLSYLTNHELYLNACEANDIYSDIVTNFESIYAAIMKGADIDLNKDYFWLEYNKFKEDNADSHYIQYCDFIYNFMKKDFKSPISLALTYAVEFKNNVISVDELFKDAYQAAFDNTKNITASNILGVAVYSSSTLREGLKSYSLFNQANKMEGKRTSQVISNLMKISKFNFDYHREINDKVKEQPCDLSALHC